MFSDTDAQYPVAVGPGKNTYHRFNYTLSQEGAWQVLTTEGWQTKNRANYAIEIPITNIPDCSPVLAGVRPSEAVLANARAVGVELATIRNSRAAAEALAHEERGKTPAPAYSLKPTHREVSAPPGRTLEEQSRLLDIFVIAHNATMAERAARFFAQFSLIGSWLGRRNQPEDKIAQRQQPTAEEAAAGPRIDNV